ncbi:pilus assembly protein [Mycolicibacterium farcinogenes]|nr:pilus assembly protein [Mycolicibacterium farcinogenes]
MRGDSVHGGDRGFDRECTHQHHQPGPEHQRLDDRGAVTVEAAFAIALLVAVLVVCIGGISAVGKQIRCIDAAREAARLAARGEDTATAVARRIAPPGAVVQVGQDSGLVVARVSADTVLPGVTVSAEAAAAVEPGVG